MLEGITLGRITEAQLLEAVVAVGRLRRWLVYHTHDSRHSAAGFPDVVLARGGRLVFVELKVAGRQPTLEQRRWLERIAEAAELADGAVEVYVWTEAEWRDGSVERVLR